MTSFRLYLFIGSAILLWWYFAFSQPSQMTTIFTPKASLSHPPIPIIQPLLRETIKKGLDGDTQLMTQLIAEWDLEARLLQEEGYDGIRLLPNSAFLKSQKLGRELPFQPQDKTLRFLPQTCVSASFLLALVSAEQIVALPSIVREHSHIYCKELTQEITLDIDRYQAEKLYQSKPSIAFVAEYSHPSTVETLKTQGIELVTHGQFHSIEDIQNTLQMIGVASNRENKSQLLSIYIDAAMLAIDNHYTIAMLTKPKERVIYLNHYMDYSLPNANTLTAELLKRLGVYSSMESSMYGDLATNNWTTPITLEQLVYQAPERLIISTSRSLALKDKIIVDPPFSKLPCFQRGTILFVDEAIQQTPSQYIVLAYFDLYTALLS